MASSSCYIVSWSILEHYYYYQPLHYCLLLHTHDILTLII